MFTSRLPVSTVRRPSQPTDRKLSSVGKSNIPTTVRKANLFTPQTVRQRPLSFGASTVGKNLVNTDIKYQRPAKQLPDRQQQSEMFESLSEFLKQHAPNLPPLDARKFFSSLSTTETARIFQCLIGQIIPDYKITRLETDVPEALALLDYPYIRSVTKSSLVSVTTRQAVVGLLFIFHWLIQCIRILSQKSLPSKDEKRKLARQIIHEDASLPFDQLPQIKDLYNQLELVKKQREEIDFEYNENAAIVNELKELAEEVRAIKNDNLKWDEYHTKCIDYYEKNKKERDDLIAKQSSERAQLEQDRERLLEQLGIEPDMIEETLKKLEDENRRLKDEQAKLEEEKPILLNFDEEKKLFIEERDKESSKIEAELEALMRDLEIAKELNKKSKDTYLQQLKLLDRKDKAKIEIIDAIVRKGNSEMEDILRIAREDNEISLANWQFVKSSRFQKLKEKVEKIVKQ